jgi:aspartyl aminopeptidase
VERPDSSPRRHLEDLAEFVSASPSPFHTATEASRRLSDAGFSPVNEAEEWPRTPGSYYLQRGGALVAWSTAGSHHPSAGFRLIGAHTDSHNLRLLPRPDHQ